MGDTIFLLMDGLIITFNFLSMSGCASSNINGGLNIIPGVICSFQFSLISLVRIFSLVFRNNRNFKRAQGLAWLAKTLLVVAGFLCL